MKCCLLITATVAVATGAHGADASAVADEVRAAMKKAAQAFCDRAAAHGGYVYYYSPDFSQRWGEGVASADQIWVQEPGTPLVGRALVAAHAATGDSFYLEMAEAAAEALLYGQLESGGWTNSVDFDPKGSKVAQYRNGRGKGRNFSTLDDGITPTALRFLMELHAAQGLPKTGALAETIRTAMDALLAAQFDHGAFPQGWQGPVSGGDAAKTARYPQHDWRTEGRIKEYWDQPTLNDNTCGFVARLLIQAHAQYGDEQCRTALTKLGDFLIAAQMPSPQRGWAQQYNLDMEPIWARAFEPPAVAGRESQDVAETLMDIAVELRDARFLKPIPAALDYLRGSVLPDGQLARYYELETNTPLYMERDGKGYRLTHSDSNLPSHYGWKVENRLDALKARYDRIMARQSEPAGPPPTDAEVRALLEELNSDGLWISRYNGGMLVGQPKWPEGFEFLSSEVFAENLMKLAQYVGGKTE